MTKKTNLDSFLMSKISWRLLHQLDVSKTFLCGDLIDKPLEYVDLERIRNIELMETKETK